MVVPGNGRKGWTELSTGTTKCVRTTLGLGEFVDLDRGRGDERGENDLSDTVVSVDMVGILVGIVNNRVEWTGIVRIGDVGINNQI